MRWYFVGGSLSSPDWPKYCPQTTTGFYDINYLQDLTYDTTNYCPQTTTGFYDINYLQNLSYDTTNYCPQTTTNFYDFAQAP